MKVKSLVVLIAAMAMSAIGAMANLLECGLDRVGETAVVTADKIIEPVDSFEILLSDAVQKIRTNDNYDNFILFVHGRGQHPCHAFDKSLITDLESDYSAKVIMYHWPSWEGMLAYPDKNARSSAKDFKAVISGLATYKKENKELVKDIKFTLFTHSMGSIVLEELMMKEGGGSLSKIFDTVVINASVSSGEDHAEWVEKIRLSENIYITINRHDPTLGKAELYQEWQHRDKGLRLLGKALMSKNGKEYVVAENAIYVDLSESPLNHVYYLHRYLNKSPAAKAFYDMSLNGIPVKLNKSRGVMKVERERVYVLAKTTGHLE